MSPALFLALSIIGTPVQASPEAEAETFVRAMIEASVDFCRNESNGAEGDMFYECVERQQRNFVSLQESVSALEGLNKNVYDAFVGCVQSVVVPNVGLDMGAVRACFEKQMNLTRIVF